MNSNEQSFDRQNETIKIIPNRANNSVADVGLGAVDAAVTGAVVGGVVGSVVAGRAGTVVGALIGAVAGTWVAQSRSDEVVDKEKDIVQSTKSAIKEVREKIKGVAVDAIEKLHSEVTEQQATQTKTSLENYCEQNPSASACLIYDE